MSGAFDQFANQRTVLLTTFRRDGTPVGTPVNIVVVDGEQAFVKTFDTAWKLKRIQRNPIVKIAPSSISGRPTGSSIGARARVVGGGESAAAGHALSKKHPILHGVLVPLVHRLRGNKTVYIELTSAARNNKS